MDAMGTTGVFSAVEDLITNTLNSSQDMGDENNTSQDMKIMFTTPTRANIVISAFLVLIVIACVFGNLLVILLVIIYKPLRIVQNFFIVSLAVSDLTIAALVMPLHISYLLVEHWIYGEIWCTLDVLLCTSSILNLCAIALDRYWAIQYPLTYAQKRPRRVGLMITAVWFTSTVVSIPPVFDWFESGHFYDPVELQCHLADDRSYVVYSACGAFYIPLAMMTFIYIKIFLVIKRRLKKKRDQTAIGKMKPVSNNKAEKKDHSPTPAKDNDTKPIPAHEEKSNEDIELNSDGNTYTKNVCTTTQHSWALKEETAKEKEEEKHASSKGKKMKSFFDKKRKISFSKEKKAIRILGIVMVTFIICWLPFFLMYLILPFCSSCSRVPIFVELFIVWLGYVNSGLNPVIYTIFNEEFRKAFHMLLCTMCKKGGRKKTANL